MEASSPFIFMLIGILIGFMIGLVCYRLFSKGQRQSAALRQTLLEREHHIAELKKSMGGLRTDLSQRLENIRAETKLLEQQLEDGAAQWGIAKKADTLTNQAPTTSPGDIQGTLDTPRDYADGKSGTLSEDFGLRENSKEQDATAPQPPRY